ncbi:MAG: hypothetical protein AB4050_02340 [Synechococcus sp.]
MSSTVENSTDNTYSRPDSGLFCLLDAEGRLAVNASGQACCFDSQDSAQEFLKANPELASQLDVQEVFVKGEVHGWEQVPADRVDERSLGKNQNPAQS